MELEEAKRKLKRRMKELKLDYALTNFELEAIETVLQELDRLQKENEKYENKIILSDEEYRRVIDEAQKDCISKDKIKCLILDKRKKIVENNIEIEECRKTIMEEQELKKLQLFTLHKNNDLLELEIADLFDLLKEE